MRHYRGYRTGPHISSKAQSMWSAPSTHRAQSAKRQTYNCPLCFFSAKSDEEYKVHWKTKHDKPKDRALAHRLNMYFHLQRVKGK